MPTCFLQLARFHLDLICECARFSVFPEVFLTKTRCCTALELLFRCSTYNIIFLPRLHVYWAFPRVSYHFLTLLKPLTLSVTKCTHFQKRQENSYICELWPGKRAAWRKNHPRILRSGLGCGGWSFDVAFIYPFSTIKKIKKATRTGLSETCHKCLSRLKGRHRGCA